MSLAEIAASFQATTNELVDLVNLSRAALTKALASKTIEDGRESERIAKLVQAKLQEQGHSKSILESAILDVHNEPRYMNTTNLNKLSAYVDPKTKRCAIQYAHSSSDAPIETRHFPRIRTFIKETFKEELKNKESPLSALLADLKTALTDCRRFAELCLSANKIIPKWFLDYYGPWLNLPENEQDSYEPTEEEKKEDQEAIRAQLEWEEKQPEVIAAKAAKRKEIADRIAVLEREKLERIEVLSEEKQQKDREAVISASL